MKPKPSKQQRIIDLLQFYFLKQLNLGSVDEKEMQRVRKVEWERFRKENGV